MKAQKNSKTNKIMEVKKSNTKRNIFLFLLALLIAGIAFLYLYAQKPAQGVVKTAPIDQKKETLIQDVPESFTGQYISFMYDNSYKLKSHEVAEKNDAVILEQAYFSQGSVVSKKIGLVVRNLPTHVLDDCPDFKMRVIKKEKYKKEEFDFGGVSSTSFEVVGDGTFEKTFFLLHKDFLAIITLSAPSFSDEKLNDEIKTIIRSVSWLK